MEKIELSIGTVYIKPLTNGLYNKALARSTVVENGVNNAAFLNYCERKMTQIPFWKWGKLTIKDGNILREKIKQMLIDDGVLTKKDASIESVNPDKQISDKDLEWFDAQRHRQRQMVQ